MGQNYQLIERARILRVFFETEKFERSAVAVTAATQLSATILRSIFGTFGGALQTGPPPGQDPISGLPAPPPMWKVIVVTEITNRRIEIPYISLTPGIQYVPFEDDYVLVLFLAGHQGVAFGHWEHIDPNIGSYRQKRLALQRGDLAITPTQTPARRGRRSPSGLFLTAGGVTRLASTDACWMLLHPFDDRITAVARNYSMFSGVHTLKIEQSRNLQRFGSLDLEVYERSISRSVGAKRAIGEAADILSGNIAVLRMGRTSFFRGSAVESSFDPEHDALFLGLENDPTGQKDPRFRFTRQLKSFFAIHHDGSIELNTGNFTPPPEPEEGAFVDPPDLPTVTLPTDMKLHALGDVQVQALRDVLIRTFDTLLRLQAPFGQVQSRSLSLELRAGTEAFPATIAITPDGKIQLTVGNLDPVTGLGGAQIEVDPITFAVTVNASLLILGSLIPVTVRAGILPNAPNVVFTPGGDLVVNAPAGNVIIGANNQIQLAGASKAVMLESIIGKFNGHVHQGVTAGGALSGTSTTSLDGSDKSAKVFSSN